MTSVRSNLCTLSEEGGRERERHRQSTTRETEQVRNSVERESQKRGGAHEQDARRASAAQGAVCSRALGSVAIFPGFASVFALPGKRHIKQAAVRPLHVERRQAGRRKSRLDFFQVQHGHHHAARTCLSISQHAIEKSTWRQRASPWALKSTELWQMKHPKRHRLVKRRSEPRRSILLFPICVSIPRGNIALQTDAFVPDCARPNASTSTCLPSSDRPFHKQACARDFFRPPPPARLFRPSLGSFPRGTSYASFECRLRSRFVPPWLLQLDLHWYRALMICRAEQGRARLISRLAVCNRRFKRLSSTWDEPRG